MQTRAQAVRRRARPIKQVNVRDLQWNYLIAVVVCGAVLAAGFFFAAIQHFKSMEYGIKNSNLRKQLESLETEKRRLMLAKEVSLSPSEIRKASRGIASRNTEVDRVAQQESTATKLASRSLKVSASKPAHNIRPANALLVTPIVKSEPNVRKPKAVEGTRDRVVKEKKRSEITTIAKLR